MNEKLMEQAKKLNGAITGLKRATEDVVPSVIRLSVKGAEGNAEKCRKVVGELTQAIEFSDVKDWEVGMTTEPGDRVLDPEGKYVYVYGGAEAMTHANPLFYPGADGVYYWHIVPETLGGWKVYPDIPGIVVAVKKGEIWWDTYREERFRWKGVDNPNCVWPPIDGNEWGKVETEEVSDETV